MKNWKTTIFGTGATIFGTLATIETPYKNYFIAGAAICGTLFALFSKDKNVTGGTTPQGIIGGSTPPPNKDEK